MFFDLSMLNWLSLKAGIPAFCNNVLLKLFQLLLAKDTKKSIIQELIKTEVLKGITPKLFSIIESVTSNTGVYYIHNEEGKILYIGKMKLFRAKLQLILKKQIFPFNY
jgi:hypothetical protein